MTMSGDTTLLDRALPHWDFHEVHRIRLGLPVALVMRATEEVTWAETPLATALLRIVGNKMPADRPIIDSFGGMAGLLGRSDHELVFGTIDPMRGGQRPEDVDLAGYREFQDPGFAKIAFNFRYADGMLTTETRIAVTDPAGRWKFRLYWLLIRLGSGLTRVSWLNAIRRRAARTV